MASKKILFTELEIGQEFMSVSGAFIKTGEHSAKRTEAHWADSDMSWFFTYADYVYVSNNADMPAGRVAS